MRRSSLDEQLEPGQFSRSQSLPAGVMVVPHMVTLRTYKVVPILRLYIC